jgi:hypothetical protein
LWVAGTLLGWSTGKAAGQKPFVGWVTNGPAVFRACVERIQALPGPAMDFSPPPEDLPMEVRRGMLMFRLVSNVTLVTNTTTEFDHYLPESLNRLVWTNFIANTNGKSMTIWSKRARPVDWPARPASVSWNHSSLIWGMNGLTAICPCWQGEGPPGWTPITALTRRHGYARGHSMGPDGFSKDLAGKKVWFLTTNNSIIEVKILRQVVRTRETSRRDYTIVLFASDLPESIQPMRVAHQIDILGAPPTKYCAFSGTPVVFFKTEQQGNVSADMPGFTVNTMKGGDSGSPNILPMPGELVFLDGRTSSGPSSEMQADMDELCRRGRLAPAKYQLQYVDLSTFPSY